MESIDRIEEKDFKMKNAYQIMAYNHGVELFENGEMDKAIEAFGVVKRYPIDPKLNAMSLYWIAEASFKKADYPTAIKWSRWSCCKCRVVIACTQLALGATAARL